jgi:hypothetical protein
MADAADSGLRGVGVVGGGGVLSGMRFRVIYLIPPVPNYMYLH